MYMYMYTCINIYIYIYIYMVVCMLEDKVYNAYARMYGYGSIIIVR